VSGHCRRESACRRPRVERYANWSLAVDMSSEWIGPLLWFSNGTLRLFVDWANEPLG